MQRELHRLFVMRTQFELRSLADDRCNIRIYNEVYK